MLNSDKQQVVHILERDPYLSLQPRNQVPVESGKRAAWIHFRLLVWFDFCFTALRHILGHFGRGQLT